MRLQQKNIARQEYILVHYVRIPLTRGQIENGISPCIASVRIDKAIVSRSLKNGGAPKGALLVHYSMLREKNPHTSSATARVSGLEISNFLRSASLAIIHQPNNVPPTPSGCLGEDNWHVGHLPNVFEDILTAGGMPARRDRMPIVGLWRKRPRLILRAEWPNAYGIETKPVKSSRRIPASSFALAQKTDARERL